jgi:hypothetical protein
MDKMAADVLAFMPTRENIVATVHTATLPAARDLYDR